MGLTGVPSARKVGRQKHAAATSPRSPWPLPPPIRGTQCPPWLGLPGPPFPLSAPPHSRGKEAHEGTSPPAPPLSPWPSRPVHAEWARDPHPLPSPFAWKGADCPTSPRWPRPLPFPLVRATPFVRNGGVRGQDSRQGGTRGHAIPAPTLPSTRGRGGCTWARRPVHAGRGTRDTPPPLPDAPGPLPFPLRLHRPVHAERATRPPFPIRAERGRARAGRLASPRSAPPPLLSPVRATVRAEWGRARARLAERGHVRACCPRHLPSSRVAPYVRKGARGTRRPTPSPSGCAVLYTRERGTRPPTRPLPIRAEGGTRGHAAPELPSPLAAPPRAREGARGTPSPGPSLPPSTAPPCTREKGARKGTRPPAPPFPLAAPPRTRGQGAREGKPPHPVASHSCRAAGPARSPFARVHRARTPFSRAIVP
ncbi:hypothetical protein EDB89DRAFT_1911319 [Lactarius sanguifluus]|nr:hypothetical protein EDB89DRAFT_1911319 [Lactarius sanguifluus]